MYNKTIISFGFCDIQNNQGLGKGYQPVFGFGWYPLYLNLDYSGYHKNLIQKLSIIAWEEVCFPRDVNRYQAWIWDKWWLISEISAF